jgi:hypothetical protein
MFASLFDPGVILGGIMLAAVQLAATLPWLWAIDPQSFNRAVRNGTGIATAAGIVLAAGAVMAFFIGYMGDSARLESMGRYVYGAILNLQLIIDLFILMPPALTLIWPKGGAVAYAAFRESIRQPMFWVIAGFGQAAIGASIVLPYYTFGDDYKMMKQICFDMVMLTAVLFGVLAASMSISEEIEGRTAITVISKPVNRRQFLIGKFVGILFACLAMSFLVGWSMNSALRIFPEYDKINEVVDPMFVQAEGAIAPAVVTVFERPFTTRKPDREQPGQNPDGEERKARSWLTPPSGGIAIARGAGKWFADAFANSLGILLGFGQVMILVAIAAALATRLPFVINIVLCLMIYFLANLAPVIVDQAEKGELMGGWGLVGFLGKLFDNILPALQFFNMGRAILREAPLDLWQLGYYALTVFGYSLIYTAIALLVGLLLFEDRDLA